MKVNHQSEMFGFFPPLNIKMLFVIFNQTKMSWGEQRREAIYKQ